MCFTKLEVVWQRVKKGLIGLWWFLYGGQLFATYHNTIGTSGKTGDDETIDKRGTNKLLAASKR